MGPNNQLQEHKRKHSKVHVRRSTSPKYFAPELGINISNIKDNGSRRKLTRAKTQITAGVPETWDSNKDGSKSRDASHSRDSREDISCDSISNFRIDSRVNSNGSRNITGL
jgi:hypothetical protein